MFAWQKLLHLSGVRLLFKFLLCGTRIGAELSPAHIGLDTEFGHEASTIEPELHWLRTQQVHAKLQTQ